MEKKKTEDSIKNWLCAIGINGIIAAAVIAFTNMTYESGDDYAISQYIVDGYQYVSFVNYYLCRALIAVQAHVSQLNVYVIFLIIIPFISFVCITKLVFDACSSLAVRAFLISALVIYSFDHYCAIQFTKTAALTATAGFIMLTDCVIKRRGLPSYIAAFILIYLGAAVRYGSFTPALGTAAVSVITWMLTECGSREDEGWFRPKSLVSTAVIIALVCGAFGIIKMSALKNTSTPELKLYDEYNLARSNVLDYPTLQYYEENKAEYDAIGISENDALMIDNWRLDYDGAASLENLKKIDAIERPSPPPAERAVKSVKKALRCVLDSISGMSTTGVHIIALFIIAAAVILTLRPKYWFYVLMTGAVTFGLYVLLYYKQRATYRVTYIADIDATLWLLYYWAVCAGKDPDGFRTNLASAAAAVMIAAAALSVPHLAEGCRTKYDRASSKLMEETTAAYLKENGDKVFIWGTGERKRTDKYNRPWLAPDDSDKNAFGTGGWDVMSPYTLEHMAEYGVANPIRDLIDNDDVLYIGNELIKPLGQYLTDWYAGEGEIIVMKKIDTVDGIAVWKAKRKKL